MSMASEYRVKARQFIAGAAFPPDDLRVIFEAFDDAWAEVSPDVSARVSAIEAARLSLATIVLNLATAGPIERSPQDCGRRCVPGQASAWMSEPAPNALEASRTAAPSPRCRTWPRSSSASWGGVNRSHCAADGPSAVAPLRGHGVRSSSRPRGCCGGAPVGLGAPLRLVQSC